MKGFDCEQMTTPKKKSRISTNKLLETGFYRAINSLQNAPAPFPARRKPSRKNREFRRAECCKREWFRMIRTVKIATFNINNVNKRLSQSYLIGC